MIFDEILIEIEKIFIEYDSVLNLSKYKTKFFVNRSLPGRIALVWDEQAFAELNESKHKEVDAFCATLSDSIGKHALPVERLVLNGEAQFTAELQGAVVFSYGKNFLFTVADRVRTEGCWVRPGEPDAVSRKMVVFYSVKGGTGHSAALAAAAYFLARKGKKILVVDMDLGSPALSSFLLPEERHPDFGLIDWLTEDAVNNGDAVLASLSAVIPLTENSPCGGQIVVVPAHGKNCKEYIAKLGRLWVPRFDQCTRISWAQRLRELLQKLDNMYAPDCLLIDARSGLDEVSSVCVLDFSPHVVLLFAREDRPTWTGYSILFQHWKKLGLARTVYDSLQVVAAMVPASEAKAYVQQLRDKAFHCFSTSLFNAEEDGYAFALSEENAPHSPWIVYRNADLHACADLADPALEATFPFVHKLAAVLPQKAAEYQHRYD